MKCAGHWGQELRADTMELHCNSWQPVEDPDTFDGRCVLCSSTRLVRIEIDEASLGKSRQVGGDGKCQQVLRAKHLLTMSV